MLGEVERPSSQVGVASVVCGHPTRAAGHLCVVVADGQLVWIRKLGYRGEHHQLCGEITDLERVFDRGSG